MNLIAMAITLKHAHSRCLSVTDARFAHAAVMKTITDVDATIGRDLHAAQKYKPITLAILSANQTSAVLRLTFINHNGIRYANLLMSEWIKKPFLRLGNTECEIHVVDTNSHPWSGVQSWTNLMALEPSDHQFTIEFNTPTAINKIDDQSKRFTGLLPDPQSIFSGLARKWNSLGGPILEEDFMNFINTGGCVVSNYQIETTIFPLPNYKQIGFVGRVTYEFRKRDIACIRSIYSLACFAFFSGIGYHTTQGMGTVRLTGSGHA
jgi:CRISPR-associated endoribonuclease Cas6